MHLSRALNCTVILRVVKGRSGAAEGAGRCISSKHGPRWVQLYMQVRVVLGGGYVPDRGALIGAAKGGARCMLCIGQCMLCTSWCSM